MWSDAREDGYHEVRMVMQMLKLYDQIDIEKTEITGHPADMQFILPADG